MSEAVNAFLFVFAALFPVVNPLGGAPIFLSLTSGSSEAERNRLARGVAFNGFWLLLGSLLLGSEILEFFGITIPVVRVAGGLLVTVMGWKLLNEDPVAAEREAVRKEARKSDINDSFYPLTMPLTVGPGAISVALTIGSHRSAGQSFEYTLIAAAILGLVAVALSIYASYRFAGQLAKFLGKVGVNVLVRLSAFILICIGIQICWSGISALLATLGQPA